MTDQPTMTSAQMVELLSCPFCGSELGPQIYTMENWNGERITSEASYVECDACGGKGPECPNGAKAVETWNRTEQELRASTPAPPAGEGDRIERGARAIAKSYGHDPDAIPTLIIRTADYQPVPYWQVYEKQAEACLAALSPSVSPAGEGVAIIDEFMSLFGLGGHPSMNWQRSLCDDGIEMVHHAGDTIFFGDPNHKDSADTERFDLIVRLVNALPSIRAALAPSGEGGMREALNKLAAECHRAKWEFDYNEEDPPTRAASHDLVKSAFRTLARIGDMALMMHATDRALSPPVSPSGEGGMREALAAWLLARDEADYHKPIPDSLVQWGRNCIAAGKDAKHSGDCTNECHSCARCLTNSTLAQADQILAALSPSAEAQGDQAEPEGK